jgi:hypothetical protein
MNEALGRLRMPRCGATLCYPRSRGRRYTDGPTARLALWPTSVAYGFTDTQCVWAASDVSNMAPSRLCARAELLPTAVKRESGSALLA